MSGTHHKVLVHEISYCTEGDDEVASLANHESIGHFTQEQLATRNGKSKIQLHNILKTGICNIYV